MGIYNLGGGGGAPELQTKEATPLITNAQQIILPDEGYDGLSKVTVNPMPTGALKTPTVNSIGYVSAGVQTAGYLNTSATSGLQLSTQAAKTITPTTYSQTAVASGKYTTGAVTVAGDSDLIASNIKSGVNIFGVSGTYLASPRLFTLTTTTSSTSEYGLIFYGAFSNYTLNSFHLDCTWTGSLANGDFYKADYVPLYAVGGSPASPIYEPIPSNSTDVERYWNVTYRDIESGYQTVIVTLTSSFIKIAIPSGVTAVRFRANSTYKLYTWFY